MEKLETLSAAAQAEAWWKWIKGLFSGWSLPTPRPAKCHEHTPEGESLHQSKEMMQDRYDCWYMINHYRCKECGEEYLKRIYEED